MNYFAHSGLAENRTDWQSLREHLVSVSQLAREMMRTAIANEHLEVSCIMAGLLHDLGKYRLEFQQMLLGLNPPRDKIYHKQAGACPTSFRNAVHSLGRCCLCCIMIEHLIYFAADN